MPPASYPHLREAEGLARPVFPPPQGKISSCYASLSDTWVLDLYNSMEQDGFLSVSSFNQNGLPDYPDIVIIFQKGEPSPPC